MKNLLLDKDVVMASIAYRLGPLGNYQILHIIYFQIPKEIFYFFNLETYTGSILDAVLTKSI